MNSIKRLLKWPDIEEAPIKHTPGAEMPDASFLSQQLRRAESDISILSDPFIKRVFVFPLVMGAALFFGFNLFFKKR